MTYSEPLPGNPFNHVRVYRPEEVTRRNEAECDPAEAGLTRADVDAIWNAVVRFYRTGLQPSLALCLRRRGKVVLDRTIGHLVGNEPDLDADAPKLVAAPDTLYSLMSASKSITSMLIHLCSERNLLRVDDAVVDYIPEFGRHGKHWITIRHVLTHTAGIPVLPDVELDLDILADPDRILRLLCDARPLTPPGRRMAYHALTGGYILAELIRRVTGVEVKAFLEREVLRPLGFRNLDFGVSPADFPRTAKNVCTGLRPVFPVSWLLRRALGASLEETVKLSNDPRFLTAVVPSGNIHCTANEASRFFQLLLGGGQLDGVRVFERPTVRRAIGEQSHFNFDFTMWLPLGYGMGFMLGHEWASLFGPGAPRAFGHIGFTNLLVWADPERDIAVALLNNGKPMINPDLIWWLNVSRVIAARCPREVPV